MDNEPNTKEASTLVTVDRRGLSELNRQLDSVSSGRKSLVSDLSSQIENLMKEKAKAEHDVRIVEAKKKAIRAAIRSLEDDGVI